MFDRLEQVAIAVKGGLLSLGGAAVLAQATPDFMLPSWAKDSLGLAALFFVGWLLLQERRDHRAQTVVLLQAHAATIADITKDKTERLELLYQSRLAESREYAAELDKVRKEQHEHSQRLYQDLIAFITAKEAKS